MRIIQGAVTLHTLSNKINVAPLIRNHHSSRNRVGQIHAPTALHPGKKPTVNSELELGGLQNRSGRYEKETDLFLLPKIETRILHPVA